MTLYDNLPDKIIYRGKKYRLNLSFNRVLQFYDLQNSDFSDGAKIEMALFLFVKTRRRLRDPGLLEAIIELIFEPSRQADNKRVMDFKQDAKYIYSAFMQTYGIDLFEKRDKLHWWKFVALLNGLPSDTRLSEIMQIRLREVPAINKHNAAEVRALLKQKAAFRLEISEEERQVQIQQGFTQMIRALEGMAQNGKN